MDTAQWPQGIVVVKPMEGSTRAIADERKPRPQKEQALNCPRCNSTNTKFCYYNNYSLSQPRYFCKTCRRYWTEGGSLRNVPVGGGSRKNKRSSSSSPASSSKKLPDPMTHQSPKIREVQDLNLAYPPSASDHNNINPNPSSYYLSAMELLKSSAGNVSSRGFSSFMPISVGDHGNNTICPSGFLPQEFKPSLNFPLEGFENLNQLEGVQEGTSASARLFFPFEDLKLQAPTTVDHEFEQINRAQGASTGYWTGMLGGGPSW